MTDLLWCATLKGVPRTKKNHQQIRKTPSGRRFVAPSKDFLLYQEKLSVANQNASQGHF